MDENEAAALQTQETPEDYVLQQDFRRVVEVGLARLPAKQRLVVMLADIYGLTYEEIAKALGDNRGTVKSRLSRGRAQMRKYLDAQWNFVRTA
jgi:RNA polymerase sigma-70 factor (ECF subfamily)